MTRLSLPQADSPIEREYRRSADALARCSPISTSFDASKYAPDAVARAAEKWRARMRSEWVSSAVFADLAVQLLEAGDSMDIVGSAIGFAHDEVRHAEVAGRAVAALGGDAQVDFEPKGTRNAKFGDITPAERAMRNVIYGCAMTEMVNTARLVDELDATSDPFMHDVTRQLLADEVVHGKFGWMYLDARAEWLRDNPPVVDSISAWLPKAFYAFERQLSHNAVAERTLTDDDLALGRVPIERLVEAFYVTVTQAVVPALERYGFAAAKGWESRRE